MFVMKSKFFKIKNKKTLYLTWKNFLNNFIVFPVIENPKNAKISMKTLKKHSQKNKDADGNRTLDGAILPLAFGFSKPLKISQNPENQGQIQKRMRAIDSPHDFILENMFLEKKSHGEKW